jgi:hypothetical protein
MRLLILTICFPVLLIASTIHVPGDQPTIQAGINAAGPGDIVEVACGDYTWSGEGSGINFWDGWFLIVMKSGVTVRSATGDPGCVTIDAEEQGGVFYFDGVDESASLEGLTLTGCSPGVTGGGVKCWSSSPMISHCDFIDNHGYSAGGGMYCYGSSPTLLNCNFVGNSASGSGGFHCDTSSPILTNCSFTGNTATGSSGGGMGFFSNCYPVLTNCTFTNNSAFMGYSVAVGSSSILTLNNCILWEESGDEIRLFVDGSVVAECSNIQEGWPGTGNIHSDPYFCDPLTDDFTLSGDSPCAPGNNGCGVLMGSFPIECTSAEVTSWGEVKTLY